MDHSVYSNLMLYILLGRRAGLVVINSSQLHTLMSLVLHELIMIAYHRQTVCIAI